MYCPHVFRETRQPILHALMRAHPLAMLITAGPGGLSANLVPFLLTDDGVFGTLRAHLARNNPQINALKAVSDVLVVFQGPDSYISPDWYPSKQVHGKAVPTWNYVMVQARGTPTLIDDANWLRQQVSDLTQIHEHLRPRPWQVDDAPAAFITTQLNGIIGLEIPITTLDGKWKVSQNRTPEDRQGVMDGLQQEHGCPAMVKWVGAHR
ncbi:FMN-binding negative transcriptional regulator [Dickeya undicola]|uniref:FMN-binding negative transcriptional regulator n=1 Tax=Dickeya undicola TaxID=1577887 RepID=A0A3N0FVI4_9GAMM|nr:FMN-binding negative transcriptional regulator [Dickeya undicola]RNM04184.1 FMN-binding negative transcriptional regulator [Dickeya undicola]RNM25211.1 FMN-binding negative transcriptional regulator [Dickeya undicola]